jgi:hypothetical protein
VLLLFTVPEWLITVDCFFTPFPQDAPRQNLPSWGVPTIVGAYHNYHLLVRSFGVTSKTCPTRFSPKSILIAKISLFHSPFFHVLSTSQCFDFDGHGLCTSRGGSGSLGLKRQKVGFDQQKWIDMVFQPAKMTGSTTTIAI